MEVASISYSFSVCPACKNLSSGTAIYSMAIGAVGGVNIHLIGSYPGGRSFGAATRRRPLRKMSAIDKDLF